MKSFNNIQRNIFINTFGITPMKFLDHVLSVTKCVQVIDIVALDKFLIEKYGNYMDGKTSCSDFIKRKFGIEVFNAIVGLAGLGIDKKLRKRLGTSKVKLRKRLGTSKVKPRKRFGKAR